MPRRTGGGAADEPNPGGHMPGGGGGSRGGGQPWATGGLNFDTKGIKEFTSEMKKAARAVEDFWKPFKDTSIAERRTNDFFKNVKKQMKEIKDGGGLLPVPGDSNDHRSGGAGGLGGNSKITNPSAKVRRHTSRAIGAASDAFSEARSPVGGQVSFRGSLWQGAQSFAGKGGMGAAGWAAAGAAAVNLAERYVDANAQPSMALQSASNVAILSQNTSGRGWSTGYRDQMAATLARQGLGKSMQGGFVGREDVAGAAMTLQKSGIQVTTGGTGTQLSGGMRQAGMIGLLTGTSGAEGAGVIAGMRTPQSINTMRMLGIQVQPGGKPQDITKTYAALANVIFGPLGRKPSKDEVRLTLRTPGSRSNLLLQQTFGGDDQQIEAFTRWVEASSPSTVGGASTDIGNIKDLDKTGVTGTTANRQREGMAATEKRRAELDKGMLRGIEQATGVTETFNSTMGSIIKALGPFGTAIGDATGFLGQMGNSLPGHSGGAHGGSLLSNAVSSLILGQGIKSIAGRIGLGGAGGGGGGGLGGLLGGAVDIGGLGGAAVAGGLALGGQAAGALLGHLGGTGKGGKRWLGKDAGTVAKYTGAGAAVGSVVPVVGTAVGAAGGAAVGVGHDVLRHLGILGDPVPAYGRMPTIGWYQGGGIGDPEAATDAAAAAGAMSLRGPGRVNGMNSDFVTRLAKMFSDNPKLSLTSGFRTRAEQEKLFREKPGLAAPPGSSKHEKGLAADIGPPSEYAWISKNFDKYGLSLPMPGKEPWHVQPSGGVAGGAMAAADTSTAASSPGGEDGGAGGIGVSSVGKGGGMGGPEIMGMGHFIPLAGGGGTKPMSIRGASTALGGSTSDAAKAGAGAASGQPVGNQGQQEIMASILKVGRAMGADPQVLLAAFETGWAESGMRNLHSGDRDSQGVFQQRPSQGWGTVEQVTDVEHAATEFFKRAVGSKYRGKGTAAMVAQSVQRSAFADGSNYQHQRQQAINSLAGLGVDASGIGDPVTGGGQQFSLVVGRNQQSAPNITIHSLTIPVTISRGTPEEAERAARTIGGIITNRDRLLEIARG